MAKKRKAKGRPKGDKAAASSVSAAGSRKRQRQRQSQSQKQDQVPKEKATTSLDGNSQPYPDKSQTNSAGNALVPHELDGVPLIRVMMGTYGGSIVGWNAKFQKNNDALTFEDEYNKKFGDDYDEEEEKTLKAAVALERRQDKLRGGLELSFAYEAHHGAVKSSALMQVRGGDILATGGQDEIVRIYNLHSMKEVGSLMQHTGAVTCMEFVGKSHFISGSEDKTVCIWRTSDWR